MEQTETYSWDPKLYETLKNFVKKGITATVGQHIGTFINVEKKEKKDGMPYIEALFLSYE